MRDSGDILFVQGAIIAVVLGLMAGRAIGPIEVLRPSPTAHAAAPPPPSPPYQRSWTPARRD